jgi:membrane-bound lytic murein transglycosylase A
MVLVLAACQVSPKLAPPVVKTITEARYEAVAFDTLPAVSDENLVAAWPALEASCHAFAHFSDNPLPSARRAAWAPLCNTVAQVSPDTSALRALLATYLQAWRVSTITRIADNGGAEPRIVNVSYHGRMTGYYEPQLNGSRTHRAPFVYPLYRVPDDLLTIDLGVLYPELAGKRVRGRLEGRRVVPYWSRQQIAGQLAGAELLWVDDALEAFLLEVQGSGRVRLTDGSIVRVGYADTNGHPYHAIGRILVERGELKLEEVSLQSIHAWAVANPQRVPELLNQNPSYVFFRELPLGDPNAGPVGALNVALTPGYSLAVDPQFIPLGSPLVITTTHPSSGTALVRLMLAQDVGGAIRGPQRFDFFWGFGCQAGEYAGRQRHDVQAWLLLPKSVQPEELLTR